jgi:sulfatase modifying factor 1
VSIRTCFVAVCFCLLVHSLGSTVQAVPVPTQAVNIEWVTVGNPGNAPDTEVMICCSTTGAGTSGYGSVSYEYRIGKYEVTAGQYTEFLNAVAADDTYGLWGGTGNGLTPMIERIGTTGSYSYTIAPDWANRPVHSISFWEAARFANWLHNGQPIGSQGPGTTEDGAYINIGDLVNFARQPGAKYFIPSEDEWYKAAYYDPNHGGPGIGDYWNYPTRTDAVPGNDITETTNAGNNLNYYVSINDPPIGAPYYRTEVGEFELSASPSGTFDQGGNVQEWNETKFNGGFVLRGGSFVYNIDSPLASHRNRYNASVNTYGVGFRIASLVIPEPGTLTILAIGCLRLSLRRRGTL